MPESHIIQPHDSEQRQFSDTVEVTVGEVADRIRLDDRLSHAERDQIRDWFEEQFDLDKLIENLQEFAGEVARGLADKVDPDTLQVILEIIRSLLG